MNCVYAIENIAGVVKEEYGYDVKGAGPESVILPVIVNRSSVAQRAQPSANARGYLYLKLLNISEIYAMEAIHTFARSRLTCAKFISLSPHPS